MAYAEHLTTAVYAVPHGHVLSDRITFTRRLPCSAERHMSGRVAVLVIAAIAVLLGGWFYWSRPQPEPAPPVATVPAPPLPAPAVEPTVRYPVPDPGPASPQDLQAGLQELLGRKAVLSFLQTDDFARRFVATVDNLGREHAPSRMWPVIPPEGRFTVTEGENGPVLSRDNSARYTPLVLLAETVDAEQAVKLYTQMYPLFQAAYEQLGFPRRYFNDRLVEVIDLLLATPVAEHPIPLKLVEVRGPVPSERPWVRYEFADPALEALPAGQKMMIRVGPGNQRRLKARLADLRSHLVKNAPVR